jgi:hypothetical protein
MGKLMWVCNRKEEPANDEVVPPPIRGNSILAPVNAIMAIARVARRSLCERRQARIRSARPY